MTKVIELMYTQEKKMFHLICLSNHKMIKKKLLKIVQKCHKNSHIWLLLEIFINLVQASLKILTLHSKLQKLKKKLLKYSGIVIKAPF